MRAHGSWLAVPVVLLLLVACTSGASPTPSSGGTPRADVFSGRAFRMELPADWLVVGAPGYDASIDASPAVTDWLQRLGLSGQHAFRAYEPVPGAGGLRLAINPLSPWRPDYEGIFGAQANVESLPGAVPGSVESTWVASRVGKGFGYRWSQELDWGAGGASRRTCLGWVMLEAFDPVNVVFSWPAGTDRTADAEALMSTFEVTGNPVWSLEPGQTLPPSPTPFDKNGTPGPMPTFHEAPDLEALLPDAFEGRTLTKTSRSGEQADMPASSPLLQRFGKTPADYATAQAVPSSPPLLLIGAQRLRGVSAPDLLAATLENLVQAGAEISVETRGGREVTYVKYGAWPVWYWASTEVVYSMVAADAELERILALLN